MNIAELQAEIHQIIDQIEDDQLLHAVHTILRSQVNILADTKNGKPLTKSELDKMLVDSEIDIQNGLLINQKDLKEEIKTWRKK